jgi:hypothetical protein
MQPSDQKRHIRQALADLVFGLALFAIFVLLGVFGLKQAASTVQPSPVGQGPDVRGHVEAGGTVPVHQNDAFRAISLSPHVKP